MLSRCRDGRQRRDLEGGGRGRRVGGWEGKEEEEELAMSLIRTHKSANNAILGRPGVRIYVPLAPLWWIPRRESLSLSRNEKSAVPDARTWVGGGWWREVEELRIKTGIDGFNGNVDRSGHYSSSSSSSSSSRAPGIHLFIDFSSLSGYSSFMQITPLTYPPPPSPQYT